jgi:hypothetical protein
MPDRRRTIASHAPRTDYAPTCEVLLHKLGYSLEAAESAQAPALRIVREDRLAEVGDAGEPIILLTNGRTAREAAPDPRAVGRIKRPAKLHEIYRLLQLALEPQPRAVPRVDTDLAAHAQSANGDQWDLRVESLSESGCLVTGPKLPTLETALTMRIEMPWGERITLPADVAYERREQVGLVFHGITLGTQRKLAKLVLRLLERL